MTQALDQSLITAQQKEYIRSFAGDKAPDKARVPLLALDDIKQFLKIDSSEEDSLLQQITHGATEYFEQYTGNIILARIITERCRLRNEICELRYGPVIAVNKVIPSAHNKAGYALNKEMYNIYDQYSLQVQTTADIIHVEYEAGIALSQDFIPNSLKIALLEMIGYLYENRGENIRPFGHFLKKFDAYKRTRL